MCVYAFAINPNEKYKFVLMGNRDEFYERESIPAHFWEDFPDILAGKDKKAGGTWLGINKNNGKIAFLTNYRDPKKFDSQKASRGLIVRNFLTSPASIQRFLIEFYAMQSAYNPFNLIFGTVDNLFYYSNVIGGVKNLTKGVYTLSNAFLDTNWYKTEKLKSYLLKILQNQNIDVNEVFSYLEDKEKADDNLLPDTGVGYEKEKLLSSIFIESETYGTVFSYFILIDSKNNVSFYEKDQLNNKISKFKFQIRISKDNKS